VKTERQIYGEPNLREQVALEPSPFELVMRQRRSRGTTSIGFVDMAP